MTILVTLMQRSSAGCWDMIGYSYLIYVLYIHMAHTVGPIDQYTLTLSSRALFLDLSCAEFISWLTVSANLQKISDADATFSVRWSQVSNISQNCGGNEATLSLFISIGLDYKWLLKCSYLCTVYV